LLEAMAASVPVVATDLAACREVLDGGRCGLLVPPGDAAAVAAAIRRLAEDERLRAQLVEAAKNRVRVHYDCGTQARSYLERLVRE
jgi:glycosyltransferase involved in cell wall biosynthesis